LEGMITRGLKRLKVEDNVIMNKDSCFLTLSFCFYKPHHTNNSILSLLDKTTYILHILVSLEMKEVLGIGDKMVSSPFTCTHHQHLYIHLVHRADQHQNVYD